MFEVSGTEAAPEAVKPPSTLVAVITATAPGVM